MSEREPLTRDARLHAALRHAPDADTSAPPLLRARIVAAAHQSAQTVSAQQATEPWHRRLTAWSAGIASLFAHPWRMGGAGTLAAALLAATVLWVGRDDDPGTMTTAASPAANSATSHASAPSTAAAAELAVAPPAAPAQTAATRAAATLRQEAAANTDRTSTADAAARRPEPVGPARPESQVSRHAHLSARTADAPAGSERPVREAAAPPLDRAQAFPQADAPPPTAGAQPEARPGTASPPAMPAPAAAPATAAPRMRRDAAAEGAPPLAGAAAGESTAPPAGATASAVMPLVERWAAPVALGTWRFRDGTEAQVPERWMAELAALTRGRWQPLVGGPPTTGEGPALVLTWQGAATARLWWSADAVVVCNAQGRCETAPLGTADQRVMRESLKEAPTR